MAGSAFGALLGAGSSFAGAMLSYSQQKALMEKQAAINYKYAEKSARNTPTWNRAGLTNAGYNPMLAVQNATSGANANWTSSQSANAPDLAGGLSSGIASAQSFQRLKNETSTAESQVSANTATAENQRADAANKRAENPYISKREEANLRKTDKETSKLQSETEYNTAAVENMKSKLQLERELGFAGLDVQSRGQDKIYNASKYSADTLKETMLETSPSSRSQSFRNYMSGIREGMSGVGDIIHGRQDNYEYYDERRSVTNHSPKNHSSETVQSRRSGRRKKR